MRSIVLRGRGTEVERLERLLRDVRAGDSRALVVTGEAGVGKSALLEHLAASATGCEVARATGVQAESELAFGTLHQLCAPLLRHLDRLPDPQRDALGTTFGLRTGPAPDRFLLGLAVLSLVAEAAADRPLVCLIDDAQWLDTGSAQVLGFVARRLMAESVALVFALRDTDPHPALVGLPRMVVEGLPPDDARALLDAAVPGPLDRRVRDRIVAETRGNPLALLELPLGLTHAELAGGFGLSSAAGLSGRIEDSFRRRLVKLSPDQRRLVLLAAADPLGDPGLLWRAAAAARDLGRDSRPPTRSRACCSGTSWSRSAIRSCARPPTGRPRPNNGGRRTARSPRPPIPWPTPTAGPGTWRWRPPAPTRPSPVSSIARPAAPGRAAGSRRRPPSSNVPRP